MTGDAYKIPSCDFWDWVTDDILHNFKKAKKKH